MTRQGLKITDDPSSVAHDLTTPDDQTARQPADVVQTDPKLDALAARRLVSHLVRHSTAFERNRPVRLLDASPDRPDLLRSIIEGARSKDLTLEITALARSEIARELMLETCGEERKPAIQVGPISTSLDRLAGERFDVVHSACSLMKLREIPRMTRLKQLERLTGTLFVWTDHARVRGRQIRDEARRVDLGFCAYRRPMGAKLFTLAGVREKPLQSL